MHCCTSSSQVDVTFGKWDIDSIAFLLYVYMPMYGLGGQLEQNIIFGLDGNGWIPMLTLGNFATSTNCNCKILKSKWTGHSSSLIIFN